jgi:hypothetical protein
MPKVNIAKMAKILVTLAEGRLSTNFGEQKLENCCFSTTALQTTFGF